MKKESKIHNVGFLISPTTHLFPLAVQSKSLGVSSMITFGIKIWNNEKLYQNYTILHVSSKLENKKGKNAKKWNERISPLGGWGASSKEPTQKRFYFIIIGYNIRKLEILENSWSLYGMKLRSYNFPKFLNFSERGDPLRDLNAPEATFKQKLLLFYVKTSKNNQAC